MAKLVAGGLWAVFELSSIIRCLFLLLLLLLSRTGYLLLSSFFRFQNHHYWRMLQWIKAHLSQPLSQRGVLPLAGAGSALLGSRHGYRRGLRS
jgi:hypothetical protein